MSGSARPPDPRPATAPPPLPAGPADPIARIVPTRNPPALIGYYLGVFSLVPLFGVPLAFAAIVCGVSGIRRADRVPGTPGRTHAWVAIVLGSVCLLGHAAFAAFLWAS